jgi:hypothetical protein
MSAQRWLRRICVAGSGAGAALFGVGWALSISLERDVNYTYCRSLPVEKEMLLSASYWALALSFACAIIVLSCGFLALAAQRAQTYEDANPPGRPLASSIALGISSLLLVASLSSAIGLFGARNCF